MSWSGIIASFLASFVEFVEALTIVLAAATVRGWRPALSGAAGAAALLAVLIIVFGPHLAAIDTAAFHLAVGLLLLLFGLRWLKKAILRAAGVLKMHDEAKEFAETTEKLRSAESREDAVAATMAFNGVFIEGVEVVFIVVAVGATTGNLIAPTIGAAAAALAVIALGFMARGPLTRIPENALKFAVGVLISSFGTFWVGEGVGVVWPLSDYALIGLSIAYAIVATAAVTAAKSVKRTA